MHTELLDCRSLSTLRHLLAFAAAIALCTTPLTADDVAIGTTAKPLNVELLQADGSYAQIDAAQAAAAKPVVYLLIPSARWDRPVARFLKTLDEKLSGYSATAEIRAIWLSAEVDATKEYLPRVQQSLQLQKSSLGVFADAEGPEGWQPGNDVQLVAIVGYRGKIAARFAFGSVNETDVQQVGEALANSLDRK
ncbi:MAG: hypothetical protein C0483_05520 [Pirellula sp.]|nr:hypothetical protein [Pirellula sp.]